MANHHVDPLTEEEMKKTPQYPKGGAFDIPKGSKLEGDEWAPLSDKYNMKEEKQPEPSKKKDAAKKDDAKKDDATKKDAPAKKDDGEKVEAKKDDAKKIEAKKEDAAKK